MSPKPLLSELTPLIPSSQPQPSRKNGCFSPIRKVLFTSFLLSMTFAFTQTSLIYSFRTMSCDAYYDTNTWDGPVDVDKCAIPRIEASMASSIAMMSSITTASTIVNLFVTGWWVKRFGVKAAMFQQTAWAAMRNLCQIYAIYLGGGIGMHVIQITQLFNILGSGGGYQLAANSFVAILAEPSERTSLFGVLGGVAMLGSSAGYTFGGMVGSYFGLLAPFQVAFCLLVFCTIFASIFLPYIAPESSSTTESNSNPISDSSNTTLKSSSQSPKPKSKSFLAPLNIFNPKHITTPDGRDTREWNLTLLGAGAFFSVLATGYVPMGLQLVATNVFGFKPAESGAMLSLNLLVRAFFLSICFPLTIKHGRRWLSSPPPIDQSETHHSSFSNSSTLASDHATSSSDTIISQHPDSPTEAEEPSVTSAPRQDLAPPQPTDVEHGSLFDLYFLRWSIFLDGGLTACVSAATHGRDMYLAAAVLPFASGTGSACKGVTMDFVEADQRADALGAIALVEKLAQVSTIGMFGLIFSALSEIQKPTMVFLVNAMVALVGGALLMFVRMPKPGQIALV